MDLLEIDNDLAFLVDNTLEITEKKRRLTGALKRAPVNTAETDPEADDHPACSSLSSSPEGLRRSTRKRFRPLETEKRRTYTKPKKILDCNDLTEVSNYYLDKKVKRLPPTLETIFEEPQEKKNELLFMSSRKFKRSITFTDVTSKCKVKSRKRIMKAKKLTSHQRRIRKLTMDSLLKKLEVLHSDSE